MATLEVEDTNVFTAWKNAEAAGKKLLQDLFPKRKFNLNIKERVQSFPDACRELNIKTHGDAFRILKLERTLLADIEIEFCDDSFLMQQIIVHALNEGWVGDYNNGNQRKWYPWFKWDGSAFVFACSGCDLGYAGTLCGSRLTLVSEDLSNYYGKQFIQIHNKSLIK